MKIVDSSENSIERDRHLSYHNMTTLVSMPVEKVQKKKVSSLLEKLNPKSNTRLVKYLPNKLAGNSSAVPVPVSTEDKLKRRNKSLAENKGSFPILRMNESQQNLTKRKKKVNDEFPYFTPSKFKQQLLKTRLNLHNPALSQLPTDGLHTAG